MKTTMILLGLTIAAPLFSADASSILLSGTSVSAEEVRATGSAKAIVGDMTVAADAITFEKTKNRLKCEGVVTIRVLGNLVTAHDCVVELSAGEKKIFFLSRDGIAFPKWEPISTALVPLRQ